MHACMHAHTSSVAVLFICTVCSISTLHHITHRHACMCSVHILDEIKREAWNSAMSLFIHPLPNRTSRRNTIHAGQKKLQSLSHSQELSGAQKVWYGLAAFRTSCLQHFNCNGVSVPGYIHCMTLPSPEVTIDKASMEKFIYVLPVNKRSLAEVLYY